MKSKYGFTLIELLAVIVILAVIALIATPIVLNIINDIKDDSVIRSGELYIDAVNNSIAQAQLNEADVKDVIYEIIGNGNKLKCATKSSSTCDSDEITVEVSGEKPTGETVEI